MTAPTILSLATAAPEYRHGQLELHDQWLYPYINSRRARAVYAAAEIETRYSVLPNADFLAPNPGTQARNELYLQAARPLGAAVIEQALAEAALTPADVDHFMVVSCTGLDTPGLDVMLAGDLHMRPDLRRTALVSMGCFAGITALDRAMLELVARPQSRVLILAVELCTLHFQHGGKLDDLIGGAIFGDGLAATVIGPGSPEAVQPHLLETMTYSNYNAQDLMGFHLSDKGFQIRLATRVPQVLREVVPDLVTTFLQRVGLKLTDIRFWGLHPGGAKIIDYVGEALELEPAEMRFARQVLRRYGNMSSASIYFVLDEIIREGRPQPGDYALLLAFGPGLTIELCLVGW